MFLVCVQSWPIVGGEVAEETTSAARARGIVLTG